MNCKASVEKNKEIIKDLLQLDPVKYKNFDEVAKFILEAPINEENKSVSLHIISNIYVGLVEHNPAFILGKAGDISKMGDMLDISTAHITKITSLLAPKKKPLTSYQSLIDKLNTILKSDLSDKTTNYYDDNVIEPVRKFFKQNRFISERERQAKIDEVLLKLREIEKDNDLSFYLEGEIDELAAELNNIVVFKDSAEIANENPNLDTFVVTLKNKEIVEGKYDDKRVLINTVTGEPIVETTIDNKRKAIYQRAAEDSEDNVSHAFFNNDFVSGLAIKPYSTADKYDDVVNIFSTITNPDTETKLYAVKLNEFTDNRVQEIKGLPGLSNKNHETFESSAQVEYLSNNPKGEVIALSRETASDDIFTIVAEVVKPDGTKHNFYIYGLNNYVVLGADNTTTKLDFTKNEDLLKVQELAVYRDPSGKTQNLTEEQLLILKKHAEIFNALKKEVKGKFTFLDNVVDITEDFYKNYSIEKDFRIRSYETLNDAKKTNSNVFHDVETVTLDQEGNVVLQETIQIPFLFVRPFTNGIYSTVNFLKQDQYILHEGEQLTHSDYLKAIGITPSFAERVVASQDQRFVNAVYLIKNKKGEWTYRIGKYADHIENQVLFSKFMSDMGSYLTQGDVRKNFQKIFKKYYFRPVRNKEGQQTVKIDFSTSLKNQFQIEIRPMTGKSDYQETGVNKKLYNFSIPNNEIFAVIDSFIPSKKSYTALQDEFTFLKDIELYDEAGNVVYNNIALFIDKIYNNSIAGKNTIVKNTLDNIENAKLAFNKLIDTHVIDIINNDPETYGEFVKQIDEDFGGLQNLFFNHYDTKNRTPFVSFGPESIQDVSDNLNVSFDNYGLINSSLKKLIITPKKVINVTPVSIPVRESKPVTNDIVTVPDQTPNPVTITEPELNQAFEIETGNTDENAPQQFDDIAEGDENAWDVPFSAEEPGTYAFATKEDIETEDEWLAKNYTDEFTVETNLDNIKDLIALTKLEGAVLGAYKDKVIYLDEQLRGKGTLYHEAFHGVFRHLMTVEDRRFLLDAVIKNKKNAKFFTESMITAFAGDRNLTLSTEEIIDRIAEEILANGFQNYMETGKAPKTILGKFFAFLQKIINMFKKNANYIDQTYEKIKGGKIKSQVVNSEMFNNEIAFENIPGLWKNVVDRETGVIKKQSTTLESKHANELIDSVVEQLMKIDTTRREDLTFDEKFDEASLNLLNDVWNYKLLEAKIPKTDTERLEKLKKGYHEKYTQYNFILGGRMRGNVIYDLNGTTDPSKDKTATKISFRRDFNDTAKDNTKGEISYQMLKDAAQKKYDHITNILTYEEDLSDLEEKENNNIKDGEEQFPNPLNEFEDEIDEQVSNVFSDKSLAEKGGIESAPKELREALSILRYDILDDDIGITVPRYVDSYETFGTLLKISSGIDDNNIIEHIREVAEMLLDDNVKKNVPHAHDLLTVYNYIKDKAQIKIDESGTIKVKNSQFYNMFIDTVKKASTDYMIIAPRFKTYDSADDPDNQIDDDAPSKITSKMIDFSINDKIIYEDINRTKSQIFKDIVSTYNSDRKTPEYREAINTLYQYAREIGPDDAKNIFSSSKDESIRLERMSKDMSDAFQVLGMNFPKSLVRLSLLGIDIVEHNNSPRLDHDGKFMQHYYNNEHFVLEGNYLEKDFFKDLAVLLSELKQYTVKDINKQSTTHELTGSELSEKLDDNEGDYRRMSVIIRNAASYIVTYDPTELPSVYRNAEGKPVYRYLPYTPILHIAEDVRKKGIVDALNDEYFENSKEYYRANPYFKDIINNNVTDEARILKLFFKNFNVSLYGGIIQSVDDGRKDGNVFKNIDDTSQYVIHLLSFLDRTTKEGRVNGEVVKMTTFTRMFTTIEATNTNYLMPALYEKYINNDGTYIQDTVGENTVDKHVNMMVQKVRQEYERMKAEAVTAQKLKEQFDDDKRPDYKGKKLVNKYNAVLDKDGITAKIDDPKLRAYNFSYFHEFFKNNPALEKELINSAKAQKLFEDLSPATINDLVLGLKEHSENKIQEHLDILVAKDILLRDDFDKDFYHSTLLPKKLKINKESYEIIKEYNEERLNYAHMIKDAYLNFWINSMFLNEVFDGDIALGVKNAVDYGKRQKRNAASNSNLKKGTHKVAYGDTILAYQHPEYLGYGPYEFIEDIKKDPKLKRRTNENKAIIATLERDFGKKVIFNGVETDTMHKLFDGQSVSLLMHHMDMYETLGRLNPKIQELIIKKQYSPLTAGEIKYLERNKVVLNSKKTVTASRSIYHKLSEMYIDRNDVSFFVIPNRPEFEGMGKKEAYAFLHQQYSTIYNLRTDNQALIKKADFSLNASTEKEIKRLYKTIHEFYKPMPHRVKLHDMLNSMEYHNIDQFMDTESSKLATLVPTNVNYKDKDGYIQMQRSSIDVPNRFKFWQVETSGIKQIIKYSVQSKVLLPANMRDITEIMEMNGEVLSVSEKEVINKEMNDLLFDYHSSLKDVAVAHEALMKTFLVDEGDNHQKNIGFMFDLIRKSLAEQNVSANKLKLFETHIDTGLPVHNANLGEIRDMLKFYFFSQFSKFTDEKGSGGKYIHMTSYGHNVIVSESGEVVFTEDYRKNPLLYGKVTTRPLGIHMEEKNGKNIYYIECILPKSIQHNPKLIAKYKDKVLKMFGTRIPTEDKRSMVALKVVDYIDSANQSGIIVPQIVHILSGSDLDIDTLYTQQYSFYKNFKHQDVLYGDYSDYTDKETGEFIEYLNYLRKDKDLKLIVKRNEVNIKRESKIVSDPNVLKILQQSGIKTDRYDLSSAFLTFKTHKIEDINFDLEEIIAEYNSIVAIMDSIDEEDKGGFVYKENIINTPFAELLKDQELTDALDEGVANDIEIGKVVNEERLHELENLKKAAIKKIGEISYILSYMKVQALTQAIASQKLPVSLKNFKEHEFAKHVVKDKFQNTNLDAKLTMLSNEYVFNNLFINERSSTQMFNEILLSFGIDMAADNEKFDQFTIDGVIQSRLKNVLSKLGIGVTANINKTLAFLSQYKAENAGNLEESIWRFKTDTSAKSYKNYNEIGGFNSEDMRTIAIIGNILGMFADGAKDPIPAALNLNEINSPITLAMLGVGMNPSFVLAYNFIPEIKKAIEEVQKNTYAIKDGLPQQRKFLSTELGKAMNTLDSKKKANGEYERFAVINELKSVGIIGKKDSASSMEINGQRLVIKYDNKQLDQERRLNNTLSLDDIGITVSALVNVQEIVEGKEEAEQILVEKPLSLEAQKYILLHLYREQSKQTSKLQSAGNIVNMFKSLKPDFDWLDKMLKDVKDLKEGNSIITSDVTDQMFTDDQVWSVIDRILKYMNQKSKMFIERSDHFEHIKNTFETLFKNKDLFAKTITSYVALNKYKTTFAQNNPAYSSAPDHVKLQKDAETKMIKDMFTANYWFQNNLEEELKTMQETYPDNEFLSRLKTIKTGNVAFKMDKSGKIIEEEYPEVIITVIGDAKFKGRLLENIEDDANTLAIKEPLFFKRLFIHDLVRTGMKTKSGSYLKFLNPDHKLPLSKHLYDFEKVLTNTTAQSLGMMDAMKQMFDFTTNDEVYTFFEDMLANLIYTSSYEIDNNNIRNIASEDRPLRVKANKGFQNIDTSNLNNPEADPTEEVINYIFPIKGTTEYVGDELTLKDYYYDEEKRKTVYNDNLIINLNTPGETYGKITQANMIDIASGLTIAFESSRKMFIFPAAIQVGNSYYMLHGVDEGINTPVGQNILFAEPFAKAKEDFVTTYNTGNIASYKRLARKPENMSLSTTSLSMKELQRYSDLTLGEPKQVLNYKLKAVAPAKPIDIEAIAKKTSTNVESVQYNIVYPTNEKADYKERGKELQHLHNTGEALYTMRVSDKQAPFFKGLDEKHNFGNPFSGNDIEGQVQMVDTKAAVTAYEDWLDGENIFTDKNGKEHDLSNIADRRDWINKQITKYKEQDKIIKVGYWKAGYRSHADVLNERMNYGKRGGEEIQKAELASKKYDLKQQQAANQPEIVKVKKTPKPPLYGKSVVHVEVAPAEEVTIKTEEGEEDIVINQDEDISDPQVIDPMAAIRKMREMREAKNLPNDVPKDPNC